jgi:hypothetical protein
MRMTALTAAAGLALLLAYPTTARGAAQKVALVLDAAGVCHMRFAGKDIVTGEGAITGLGLDRRRHVHLVARSSLPYRCVGGAIYMLQAGGVRDVGFDAAPPGP